MRARGVSGLSVVVRVAVMWVVVVMMLSSLSIVKKVDASCRVVDVDISKEGTSKMDSRDWSAKRNSKDNAREKSTREKHSIPSCLFGRYRFIKGPTSDLDLLEPKDDHTTRHDEIRHDTHKP